MNDTILTKIENLPDIGLAGTQAVVGVNGRVFWFACYGGIILKWWRSHSSEFVDHDGYDKVTQLYSI